MRTLSRRPSVPALLLGTSLALWRANASAQTVATAAPPEGQTAALQSPSETPPATAPAAAPTDWGRSRRLPIPGLRFGFGSHTPLNAAAGSDSGFAFDLQAGFASFRDEGVGLIFAPEFGYSYDASEARGGHFFNVGGALMVGSMLAGVGVSEHLLVGDSHRDLGYGVRSSLALHLLANSIEIEVGHQWVRAAHEDRHEIRWTISINPLPLVAGIFGLFLFTQAVGAVGRTVNTAVTHPGDFLLPPGQRPVH